MLQTAQYYRTSNDKEAVGENIVPIKSEHDFPFAYSLKIGTMVLLYEKSQMRFGMLQLRNEDADYIK